jgi:hypothetical protein
VRQREAFKERLGNEKRVESSLHGRREAYKRRLRDEEAAERSLQREMKRS